MKSLKLYAFLGLSTLFVLSACEKNEITEDPGTGSDTPALSLSETTLTVSAEGAVASVAYQVENPVDGATISVDLGDVTWISDVDVTDSTIDLTVDANSESESRTASLTVSYPGAEDVSLTVVQEAVESPYDYNYTLEDFVGYIYDGYGNYGEDMYYIWLSDVGFDDSGDTQTGGHYYNFTLFVNEGTGKTLPTGTYTYTDNFYGDYVFSSVYSRYFEHGTDSYTESYLAGGSITISAVGDTYTIEGVVTDNNGATHHVYYNGPADVWSFTMEEDLEFTATTAIANFFELSGNIMNVDLIFTDMEYDGTYAYPPGSYVALDTFMPYDEDGKIATGTYNVNTTSGRLTIYPYYYSYVYYYETTSDYTYSTIASGTMTVEAGSQDDYYTISCEFKTETEATVKCTYTGYLVVNDVPGGDSDSYSTLTGDITLNLNGALSEMYNYDDYFENGGTNLYLAFYPENYGAGDVLFIDINATAGATVPSGTYTASTTDPPAIGEFLYGYAYDEEYTVGSWYYEYDEFWDTVNMAPLVDGSITFTNNNNGTYTMTVACKDDLGYSISGTWTGSLDSSSYFSTSTSVTSSSKSFTISKPDKQKINAKTAEIKAAKKEDRTKVSVSAKESRTGTVSKALNLKK